MRGRATFAGPILAVLLACAGAEVRNPPPVVAEPVPAAVESTVAAAPESVGVASSDGSQEAGAVAIGAVDQATNPRSDELTREAVGIAKSGGDPVVVRQKLAEAVASGGAGPLAYYNLAVADLRAGDLASAEEHAWKGVEVGNGHAKLARLYVEIMDRWGRAEAGLSNLERLSARMPEAKGLKLGIVDALLVLKKPADALQRASDLLRKDETNVDVMIAIAKAYLAMERLEAAEYVLGQALELRKEPRAYVLMGTMAWRKGDARRALGFYQEALKLDAGLADAHNNLAVLYQDAGDPEAAAVEALAALQLDSKYADAWLNLGNARRVQRNFGEAMIAYQQALGVNPDCADCEFNLGVLELERKPDGPDEPAHYRRAIEHLQRYKSMRRGAMRGDATADSYLDEARRMSESLEDEAQRAKEAPPAEVGVSSGAAPSDGEVPDKQKPVGENTEESAPTQSSIEDEGAP